MKGISTFTLKWIAIISMLIDHIGYVFFPEQSFFRIVGRLAFPIFAYTLVEGFFHTQNVKKYLLRLAVFALLSEVPFDLMVSGTYFDLEMQNVFFTLFLGLLMLILIQYTKTTFQQVLIVFCAGFISRLLHADYDVVGIITIGLFFYLREKKVQKFTAVGLLMLTVSWIQMFAVLAFIPIALHNGERGPKMKLFFYAFYPLHLLVLYFVQSII